MKSTNETVYDWGAYVAMNRMVTRATHRGQSIALRVLFAALALLLLFAARFQFTGILQVLLALLGVALGSRFCENVFYQFGQPGELFSTGTIFLMGTVVGIEVLAGVSALVINMLGVLLGKDADHRE